MATKAFHICSCIFLLFFVLPLLSHAEPSKPKAEKPSPFAFIKNLEGCKKGEKVKGLNQLKAYLEKFGYLNYSNSQKQSQANDEDFDDLLEAAIKTYQLNYHLKPTGTLDAETVTKMMGPRCGVADIINGTNYMQEGKKRPKHGRNTLHTVSHYSFFQGNPKWPPSKYHLTYAFLPGTDSRALGAVAQAFDKWASATQLFTFSQSQDLESADLTIGFQSGDHGDGFPFDGLGGAAAHAFAPTNGRFHYDGDETWSVGSVPGAIDLESVALHEIGHLLGLGHSSDPGAIMASEISYGQVKLILQEDDIEGIKVLYNV